MEAAALYALAKARGRAVLCLAHATDTMAQAGDDLENGEDHGAREALQVLAAIAAINVAAESDSAPLTPPPLAGVP